VKVPSLLTVPVPCPPWVKLFRVNVSPRNSVSLLNRLPTTVTAGVLPVALTISWVLPTVV
jgi:hypothetical protein